MHNELRTSLFIMLLCFSCLLGKAQPPSFFTYSGLNMPDGDLISNYVLNEMDSSYEAVYGFNPLGPPPNFNFVAVFDKEGHFTHNKYFGPINLSYVQLWGFFYIPFTKSYAITGSFDDGNRQMIWPMNFFMDSTWQLVGMNQSDTVVTWYESINDSIYSISGYISANGSNRNNFIAEQNIRTFEISDFFFIHDYTDSVGLALNLSLYYRRGDQIGNNYIIYTYDYILNRFVIICVDKQGNFISFKEIQTGTISELSFENFFFNYKVEGINLVSLECFDKYLNTNWSFQLDSNVYGNCNISYAIRYQENNILVISEVIDSTYIFTVLDTNGTVLKEVNIPEFHHDTIDYIDYRLKNGAAINTKDGGVLFQVYAEGYKGAAYLMKMDSNFHVLNSERNFYIPFGYNAINEYVNESASVSLFPNPTTSHFTIQSSSTIKSLTVYNLQGQQLLQKSNLNATSYNVEEQLPSGVYVVKVETNDGKEIKKICITN